MGRPSSYWGGYLSLTEMVPTRDIYYLLVSVKDALHREGLHCSTDSQPKGLGKVAPGCYYSP